MEIGTNRPDAMNHYGVAREASAIYNLPLQPIAAEAAGDPKDKARLRRSKSQIRTAAPATPPASFAMCISSHRRQTSRSRLTLVDQRPINNAADATNYTLWEMGHPTHVFDLDLLEGGKDSWCAGRSAAKRSRPSTEWSAS